MRLVKRRIAAKLASGFGFCVLLMAMLVSINYASLRRLDKLYHETWMRSNDMVLAVNAQQIGVNLEAVIAHAIINRDMVSSERAWSEAKKENLAKLQKVMQIVDSPREMKVAQEAQSAFDDVVRIYEQRMLPLIKSGEKVPDGPLADLDRLLDTRVEVMERSLQWLANDMARDNKTASWEFNDVLTNTIRVSLIISLFGVVAAVAISALSTRRIVRPIAEITDAAFEMERGRYFVTLKHQSEDETGVLANAFRAMSEQVHKRTIDLEDANQRLSHEIHERQQAQDAIIRLNAGLEQMVSERTATLDKTVESLRKEVLERTSAEKALKQSEELLRIVLEILPVGICVMGREGETVIMGNKAGKMIWCGDKCSHMEMTGDQKGWRPGTGQRLAKEEWPLARAIGRGETTLNEVIEIECLDGSLKTIAVSAVPITNPAKDILAAVEVIEDITERRRADERLKTSHEQLRNLSAYLEVRREKDRSRIAREIHDELGQLLTVLKFDVSWLKARISSSEPLLVEKMRAMTELIDTTIDTVRRIASDLRPQILDHLGLATAVEWYAQQFQIRTGIVCQSFIDVVEVSIDGERSVALFRIFQEALTNILRHADASEIEIRLRQKRRRIHLTIADNGKGIGKAQVTDPRSVGLTGMRERALLLKGKVSIRGFRGKGTIVKVGIPMQNGEKPDDQNCHS